MSHFPRRLVLAACAVLLVGLVRGQEGLSFNGRTMAEWMTTLREDTTPRKRRAAVVALGQIAADHRDAMPTVVAALGRALRSDASPAVREQAATVLGQQPPEDVAAAVPDLAEAVRSEKEPAVRREVASTLGRVGPAARQAVPPLTVALKDADPAVRAAAADALGRVGSAAAPATPELLPLLKDADKAVRLAAVFALGRVEPDDTGPPAAAIVGALAADPDPALKREALLALGFLGDTSSETVRALAGVLADGDAELRDLAVLTLGRLGPSVRSAEPELTKTFTSDASKQVRLSAVRTLCRGLGSDAHTLIPVLTERLKADPDFEVRVAVAEELGAMGPAGKGAVPALRLAQRDPQIKVREAAAAAIKAIEKPLATPKS